MDWKQTIIKWRKLSAQERRQRHLSAIPRGVTTSMAMERQPVTEQFSCPTVEPGFSGVATLEAYKSAAFPEPQRSGLFVGSICNG